MKKTLLTSFIISCLLSTMFLIGFAFNIQSVRASGTITINADGSIDPPDAPINTTDRVTYYFTDNINEPIVVQRDNIVVDGKDYTLQGTGAPYSKGIILQYRNNITIKKVKIITFWCGIVLTHSSDNTISGNNIVCDEYGIQLGHSSSNTISGNNITDNDIGIELGGDSSENSISENEITNNRVGIELERCSSNNFLHGNLLDGNGYGFDIFGFKLSHYLHSIDTSNLVDGKPVYYLISQHDLSINPSTHPEVGFLALINSTNITVEGLTLTKNCQGLLIVYTNNTKIQNNTITNNGYGIELYQSSSNSIQRNNITANNWPGVTLEYSSSNTICGNNMTDNEGGIQLSHSSSNTISGNKMTDNDSGIGISESSNNFIYHNNFVDNTEQVYNYNSTSVWDNGYPSGGNYWSNYTGIDLDHDGIGDSWHEIDENNTDQYPLMGMFSVFNATSEYYVQTICNSTISGFQFNGSAICFDVTGEDGTTGYCRSCIPTALLNDTYRVFVNSTEVPHTLLPCSNSTHSYLYFNYTLSTKEVIIIPEFPSFPILPLIMIATLLAVIVYRRKHSM